MPLNFTPKKEEELKKFGNLPPGEYPFTVLESAELASKSAKNAGKMMCAVKLNVHGPQFDRHVFCYFADWFNEHLLKHFCEGVGLGADYAAGKVDSSNQAWQGKTGWVKLGIEPAKGNYPEKNVVDDFIVKEKGAAVPAPKPAETDDVPF